MARKHAQYGPRRAVSESRGADARATTGALELPRPVEADERLEVTGPVEAALTRTPTTEEIETNAFSGPITVPRRLPLGETGLAVHPLALGASTFGWTVGADDAADILDRFAGVGGNLLDTADSYAAGRSETIIGRWMAVRGARDRVRVITRWGAIPTGAASRPSRSPRPSTSR